MPASYRDEFKASINEIKQKHKVYGELKWSKVSPFYFDLYIDLIDYFFSTDLLRSRVLLVESIKVDNVKFNNADAELGFYKFYYQLLHHWIFDFNNYEIFVDFKVNRDKGRILTLESKLDNANLTSDITQIQALPSNQSSGIQLADFITGLVAAKFNGEIVSIAKLNLIKHIENKYIKKQITQTGKWEEKFNVFKINLQGGW
ncbi:DUF3800 domain-containing protein [Flavobacterium sp. 11]|uniref:DUF3800 domain-containing protein n=1 Tax=Flavobacterium sp. 11 TaxID=357523 RepID=UPI000C372F0E|nr:DUF3800 domain-containing protein [Flavobacterium sp. 11]PIF61151.1 uncharacterized protein DUF3800 [Flavobacterium sp. 11]